MTATSESPAAPKPVKWWHWVAWSIAIWVIPGCMLAVWGKCYTEVFGEPPCEWAEVAINGLFLLNLAVVGLYQFRFRNQSGYFLLTIAVGIGEIVVASLVWFWGGMSVSGFYL